ncbi:MAG: hypothetical protein ABEH78_06165 [Haloferacaceae archaeon]
MADEIRLPGRDDTSASDATTYADRLDTLADTRLAYVDWGKPNGDRLYEHYAELLAAEFDVAAVDYYEKPSPSSPIPQDMFETILDSDADGVILAIADCGSCNSSVVIDAKDLEEANVPTVQVITDEFLALNDKISASHGYEHLPRIVLDHPTRYLDDDDMGEIATRTVWTVQTALTCEECLVGPGDA